MQCTFGNSGPPIPLSRKFAASFVNAELGVANVDEALEGARHILAERISEHVDIRKRIRERMLAEGVIIRE